MDELETNERSPRDELLVQTIKLAAMLVVVLAAPVIERAMSDPDVAFKLRWHLKRQASIWKERLNEANILVESALGIWMIEDRLRQNWRRNEYTS